MPLILWLLCWKDCVLYCFCYKVCNITYLNQRKGKEFEVIISFLKILY